jgi:hypothetical protein
MTRGCLCTYVPYGETEVLLTTEGCPIHDPAEEDDP